LDYVITDRHLIEPIQLCIWVPVLKLEYFVGDAFEELRVDDPTTVEAHTADVEPTESSAGETEITSSLRVQSLISTYIYILEQLGEEAVLSALYEEVYLESARFCKQYAERLIEAGERKPGNRDARRRNRDVPVDG